MNQTNQKTYRVTRPNVYGPGTPGYKDPSARQGHYVNAHSIEEAENKIRERHKLSDDERLESEVWD